LTVDEIDFIEAHGTGTPLGDPQEIQSISNVFEKRSDKLPIGALKSNIGHLEGAAGIAGVIKTIMCLQKQTLPPNINFTKPNPRIVPYLKKNIFLPVDGPCKLKEGKNEYNAGVSSFGFGGTNSHVIISYKVK
jgi:microcystin synthetase protein McyD